MSRSQKLRLDFTGGVALLADRCAERKLLELRANEPELEADGRWMGRALGAAMLAGAAVLLMAGVSAAV